MGEEIKKRIGTRLENLKQNEEAYVARFDLNGDGILDADEIEAALATVRNEVLRESRSLTSLVSANLRDQKVLGRYEILSELGSGAQSTVYVARDLTNQALVAIKQMRVAQINNWDAFTSFQRESEVLATLDHPQIPRVIELKKLENEKGQSWVSVQSFMLGTNLEHQVLSNTFFYGKRPKRYCCAILKYFNAHPRE